MNWHDDRVQVQDEVSRLDGVWDRTKHIFGCSKITQKFTTLMWHHNNLQKCESHYSTWHHSSGGATQLGGGSVPLYKKSRIRVKCRFNDEIVVRQDLSILPKPPTESELVWLVLMQEHYQNQSKILSLKRSTFSTLILKMNYEVQLKKLSGLFR